MLEIGKCKEVFQRVDRNQCELLRAKSKKNNFNAKKNKLLHYSRYANSGAPKLTISGSKKIHKFKTRNAYREGNYCQGSVTWARIWNEQPEYSEVQYMPGVPHWEGCYYQTGQLYMQEISKIEMIQIISLKIICIHFGMKLKMMGPSKWIQMERRFLNLIDLTNCWDWALLRNCWFKDVQVLCHQYICQMGLLHWKVIALYFHKTLLRCATRCCSGRRL